MQRANVCSVDLLFQDLCNSLAFCLSTFRPHPDWLQPILARSMLGFFSEFVCFCLSNHLLRIYYKFSMALQSGEFNGRRPKILMCCSQKPLMRHHAGKGIVHHQTVLGWFGGVALEGLFWHCSLYMAVNGLRMLYCWLWQRSPFLQRTSSSTPTSPNVSNIQKGDSSEKMTLTL